MRLLRALTLLYTGVLVSALGTSLTAIWVYLRRIAATLGEARAALGAVSDDTAPLDAHLRRLHDATAGVAGDLAGARESLARADDRLAALAERPGTAEAAR